MSYATAHYKVRLISTANRHSQTKQKYNKQFTNNKQFCVINRNVIFVDFLKTIPEAREYKTQKARSL